MRQSVTGDLEPAFALLALEVVLIRAAWHVEPPRGLALRDARAFLLAAAVRTGAARRPLAVAVTGDGLPAELGGGRLERARLRDDRGEPGADGGEAGGTVDTEPDLQRGDLVGAVIHRFHRLVPRRSDRVVVLGAVVAARLDPHRA